LYNWSASKATAIGACACRLRCGHVATSSSTRSCACWGGVESSAPFNTMNSICADAPAHCNLYQACKYVIGLLQMYYLGSAFACHEYAAFSMLELVAPHTKRCSLLCVSSGFYFWLFTVDCRNCMTPRQAVEAASSQAAFSKASLICAMYPGSVLSLRLARRRAVPSYAHATQHVDRSQAYSTASILVREAFQNQDQTFSTRPMALRKAELRHSQFECYTRESTDSRPCTYGATRYNRIPKALASSTDNRSLAK